MRKLFATAAALAPLMVAAGAQAEVVISTTRNTPIQTVNATGSAADNIRISSGGTLSLTTGTAITVNSNNTVVLDSGSSISMANSASGATGILVNGGTTTSLRISGSITVVDDIETYPDLDNDGDVDGPWANGSGRYGVRLAGTAAVTGDVIVEQSGTIRVDGNDSYGIAIDAPLIGNLSSFGAISTFGDRSVGVSVAAPVTGNVSLDGSIGASGLDAMAISTSGDISGRLTIQGSVSATGYRYTSLGSDAFIARLDPDDLLQGGPAISIAGNVAGGVVLDRPPTLDAANADADGDGRADAAEGTATISSFGSAAGVQIGSATRGITLGVAGTGDNAFGFINRGTVSASGVYDGIDATSVRFGVAGGQSVTVNGGIRNEGSIAALSNGGSSTGLRIGTGTTASTLVNSGFITAGAEAKTTSQVSSIVIERGASLLSLINNETILTTASGGVGDLTAIRDLSGTLTTITNNGLIQANLTPNAAGDPFTAIPTAIDVRANTTGVTIRQVGIQSAAGSTENDDDGDGIVNSEEPLITGAILLGSGDDLLDFQNGFVLGDLSFGAGADRLLISGGAFVRGALSDTDGLLDINVSNGTLESRQTTQLAVTGLNVGADGNLLVAFDPAGSTSGGFRVNGTANLQTGAGIGVRFTSLLTAPRRFTLVDADTLIVGTLDQTALVENSPYLYVVSSGIDAAAGEIFVDARARTAAEADMIAVEASAFESFYSGIGSNSALLNAFLSETSRDGFFNLFEQTLPDHSGGPLMSLASGVDAVTRALTNRNSTVGVGETSAWVQEINFYADKDKTDTYGFRSEGFGVAAGVERGTDFGSLGVSLAFTSSDIQDPEAEAEEVLSSNLVELGLYWRAQGQNWSTWARAAGGYATFEAARTLVGNGLYLSNTSEWSGFTLALAAGASYEQNFGRINIRPEVYAEYFGLNEESRTETGAGNGFDLEIDDREGHILSSVAAINIGYGFGTEGWIRPELRLGWRQNLSVEAGETIGRFISGSGPDFRLTPQAIKGGGLIAGLRLSVGNELGRLSINADAEQLEDYIRYTLLLRASFRF
jgi:hypothetical protein